MHYLSSLSLLIASVFALFFSSPVFSQEQNFSSDSSKRQFTNAEPGSLEAIPPSLISEALVVKIYVNMGKDLNKPDWEQSETKYTIPGSAFSLKLMGTDTIVVVTITPYKNKSELLLVNQGQIWCKESDDSYSYKTTVDSLAVKYGERVYFYPFGKKSDKASSLRVVLVFDKYIDQEDEQKQEQNSEPNRSPEFDRNPPPKAYDNEIRPPKPMENGGNVQEHEAERQKKENITKP